MLKQLLVSPEQTISTKPSAQLRDSIQPFEEQPSTERYSTTPDQTPSAINASDLFSMFTADIINKKTKFTR